MYSSESDSEVLPEDNEEGKLYQLIYELTSDDKDQNEEVQIPSSSRKSPVDVRADGTVVNDRTRGHHMHTWVTRGVSGQASAERPWREPGAVTSDYFNYGFNEESWKLYQKHAGIRLGCRGPVQKGRTAPEETSPPGGPSPPRASRRPIDPDGTGGRAGRRGAVRGPRTPEDEGNSSKVDVSPDEDGLAFLYRLPRPDFSSPVAFVPPPPVLRRSSKRSSPLGSGHSEGSEDPSLHQRSSGASSLTPRSTACSAGPVQNHDRERTRAHGRGERDKGNCSSSHRGERTRSRAGARRRRRPFDSLRRETEGRCAAGGRRRRHEERRESSSSSSRRSMRDEARGRRQSE